MEFNNLVTLGKIVANAKPTAQVAYSFGGENYSYSEANEAFRKECRRLAGTYQDFRENKNVCYRLMEELINDVLPKRTMDMYGNLANIMNCAQGTKPVFTQKITTASKRRAKQFVTKVGLAGIYEVFKLDGKSYEIPTSAFGGAAQIGFEEFLDGTIDLADVLDIILEGLDEAVFLELQRALAASVRQFPRANRTIQLGFNEKEMDRLLSIADSYGTTSTIFCTFEFAATMVPSEGWVSDDMRNQRWNNGYLASYKGHRVIVFPQSYTDETNEVKTVNPQTAWIIPTNNAQKPVTIAFEGTAIVRDIENSDMSREVQIYKKFGVAVHETNDICVYVNTELTKFPYKAAEDVPGVGDNTGDDTPDTPDTP